MVRDGSVTSFRIVSVDHYMHKPEPRFDSCYSEFRGSDVRQVPVVRLFGSTADGTHSCVHIHGVFPYLYVPYDGASADSLAVDRLMYQIAGSLDKAINVSLGNANSAATHVFRIALVKGIPIYGYHRKEHQFFKIFLYNPYFIRKATNLLMNGVIMSRVFQTYETHVPYILQFFIDYNLYGMSLMNVPTAAVQERGDGEGQLAKMSTSEYEVDILAVDILNRATMEEEKRSPYANPGIASIWNDEQARRRLLEMDQPEALSLSQSGKVEIVTESDRFYRSLLAAKIASESRPNRSDPDDSKRMKPPVSFLPSEAAEDEPLLDASCVQDHKNFTQQASFDQSNTTYNFDLSQVDEERIISMSQHPDATFADEDHELLDIMKELEGRDQEDGDSLLAPLTQQSQAKTSSSQGSSSKRLNATLGGDLEAVSLVEGEEKVEAMDSDDEFLLDYTLKTEGNAFLNDSDDEFLESSVIPQLDGADGEIPSAKRTRHNGVNGHGPMQKRVRLTNGVETKKVPLANGLPRTRKAGKMEEVVLNGVVANGVDEEGGSSSRKKVKVDDEPKMKPLQIRIMDLANLAESEFGSSKGEPQSMTNGSSSKSSDVPQMKQLQIRIPRMDFSNYPLPSTSSSPSRDTSPYDEFRLAREYDLVNNWDPQEGLSRGQSSGRRGRGRGRSKKSRPYRRKKLEPEPAEQEPEIDLVLSQQFQDIIKLSPKVLIKPINNSEATFVTDEVSRCSQERPDAELPEIAQVSGRTQSHTPDGGEGCTIVDDAEEEEENDLNIKSFYEQTLAFDDFDELGSGSDESVSEFRFPILKDDSAKISVTLEEKPPSFEDALEALQKFIIPQVINREPFYSNPDDVTGRKEVGHVVLNIGGSSLNDLEEFKSVVPGLGSINQARYEKLSSIYGEDLHEALGVSATRPNAARLKELLATEAPVVIHSAARPPSKHEAKVWLEAMKSIRVEKETVDNGQDSPIKVKKMQAIMAGGDAEQSNTQQKPRIDHDSTLNLSSLISDDNVRSSGVDSSATKSLVSKILSMNTRSSPARADSPTMFSPSAEPNQLELLSYSARRKRRPKARLSLSAASGNISAATPRNNNTYGFKVSFENLQKAKATCEYNHLAVMSVELHVQTRGDLRPNPDIDPISAVFYRIHNDVPADHRRAPSVCGIILNRQSSSGVVSDAVKYNQCSYTADVVVVGSERELYEKFLVLISFWDPDIFAGYEIEAGSWGYLIQRGYALEMNLMKMLSRVPTAEKVHVSEEEEQDLLEMHEYSAGLKIPGRILLDIWRLMRHEIALTSYTFENMVYHILHRRVSRHSFRFLTRLWNKSYTKWVVLEYYLERVNGNLELLQQLDLIGRTAELAKLFGIQFYEVLSRGSQFRVESMMLRIAKPRNFVSVSPSIQQRAHMRSPEYLPLILEPNSRFYADPLIVLDFQSLYPSIIIAYNYCFSTCLGRVEHLGQSEPFEFGASQLRLSPRMLKVLVEKNLVTVSPCGAVFVKSSVREGILPRMLNEILTTRLMVKASMKLHKENSILQRVLHSRQLGLKLIANVTYGYTAANFSGRMPCVEVGDSVVSKGRETLERAIKLVESTERWGAKVMYGDTDSMFVLCPGRTRQDAFKIGEEIAEAVTRDNPPPVKLKLEKVYQPSILQTKKHYVGYMYESPDQEKPVYEAKGIETVRRDGCPVVSKMLEKVLRILFETQDVSRVKEYTCRQFTKILEDRVNVQDYIFAKEFRGQDGYKPGACVPALELTRRWKAVDPRREPRRGERVPYVIINGPPLVPLIRLVRSPDELLADPGLKINSNYYITKAIIPPLNRCLLLIGADVNQWYNDLPRKVLMLHNTGGSGSGKSKRSLLASELQLPKKSTISQYFSTTSCVGDCGNQTHRGVCGECLGRPQRTVSYVMDKINRLERRVELGEKMCKSCCQRTFETACTSLDCPVLFVINRRTREHGQVQYYRDLLEEMF
ncbi:DNA polymerase zeta catalytic subunit [Culex quinquefasciatus]|uniref:DNA polymerase n=1 Tax=Culex quinquefasciatus TaxID=7176 RepID=B0X1E8_CULQU|nr:DNA polymerase zeta catalytic subunit [Culex quinquefasciatus]|eukprot:XP_001863472.1 DNA polymerase zeta catalytic subunit [Culex quinquefasciatus]